MRVLTLHQPWATLMASGLKSIETRIWSTSYRGLVAIHAGKNTEWMDTARLPSFKYALADSIVRLPRTWFPEGTLASEQLMSLGHILAIGRLVDCQPTMLARPIAEARHESEFGDYTGGRFGLFFRDVIALPRPLAHRGMQGLAPIEDPLRLMDLTQWYTEALAADAAATEPAPFMDHVRTVMGQ